jgi:hypothetical protein
VEAYAKSEPISIETCPVQSNYATREVSTRSLIQIALGKATQNLRVKIERAYILNKTVPIFIDQNSVPPYCSESEGRPYDLADMIPHHNAA